MPRLKSSDWLPERQNTEKGVRRRIGVEIELAGVEAEIMSQLIVTLYGGDIVEKTRFEIDVTETEFGDFKLELDSSYLQALATD